VLEELFRSLQPTGRIDTVVPLQSLIDEVDRTLEIVCEILHHLTAGSLDPHDHETSQHDDVIDLVAAGEGCTVELGESDVDA